MVTAVAATMPRFFPPAMAPVFAKTDFRAQRVALRRGISVAIAYNPAGPPFGAVVRSKGWRQARARR